MLTCFHSNLKCLSSIDSCFLLRILTGKTHPKARLNRLWKVRILVLAQSLNQLFIKDFYTQINVSKKIKLWAKLYKVHFLLLILFVLTLAFGRADLYGNVWLSILLPPTKNGTPVLKKGFSFLENLFQS